MNSSTERPYDIIVFGATSFVGQILCEYLADRHRAVPDLMWAIAGRDPAKLDALADRLGLAVDHLVADATDASALTQLAASTRVIVSTVGPYAIHGSLLVECAVAAGTDYCDLTGEPQWMQAMIDAHHEGAARSGARIVHACGFDSIPSDLGVFATQSRAMELLGEHCTQIHMRVKAMKGGASGGTVASMLNVLDEASADPALRRILTNPYALAPDGMRTGVRQPNVTLPTRDDASGRWIAPFLMASVNTRIVHRSHALLGRPWGEDFLYDEALMTGQGPLGAARAGVVSGGLGGFMAAATVGPIRRLLEKTVLPKPGDGPSRQAQEDGFFDIRFYGTTASGARLTTRVTGDRDPGYGSTAKMLGEATLTLLEVDPADVPGGFWTPSTALGEPLVDRLVKHAGIAFDVID